jgi:Leucine Rich repeat
VTVQAKPTTRRWWNYMRFTVRGLIVLVLLIGGWLGWVVRSTRIQREAVAAIRNGEGDVRYDWEWSNGVYNPAGKPWAPQWLVGLIGVDFFGHVNAVWLNVSATDAAMVEVGRLTRVQALNLDGTHISDAGLVHLKGLTELAKLELSGTQITDAGLAHLNLRGLSELAKLDLRGTQVSDVGLAHLKGLTKLGYLDLRGTQLTDAGLVHLKRLTNLAELGLFGTRVSDDGLAHLKGLTELSSLGLTDTQVTDAGMQELQKALPNLRIVR